MSRDLPPDTRNTATPLRPWLLLAERREPKRREKNEEEREREKNGRKRKDSKRSKGIETMMWIRKDPKEREK
jgi:hypothetical protein